MSFDLSGKTALVTGASTGLGQAIAIAMASAGASVVCAARSSMEETRARIAAIGGSCQTVPIDLARPGAPQALIERAWNEAGPVTILVNNAATIARADAADMTEEQWDQVMDLNVKQLFFASQAFARHLFAHKYRGKIINLASIMSLHGGWRVSSYTASKHAVAGLTRILACEWAARGINVNALAPGFFDTDMNGPLRTDDARYQSSLSRIPVGRWGRPDEIGGAAVFLASEASDYIHGILLPVDGGWLAK
jgi:2-deoxy-D-gluconate 3-dehydrogenase